MLSRSTRFTFIILLTFAGLVVSPYAKDANEWAAFEPTMVMGEHVGWPQTRNEISPSSGQLAPPIDVSLAPEVSVRYGTPAQHQRLDLALSRFREAGLPLPDLEVIFAATNTPCKGKYGLFQTAFTPWRLTICSELDSVYEHELAHGWLAATLTELKKDGFMKLRGYTVWSDQSVPWNERAMEGVAFSIQQGLSGLPLPPSLGVEQLSRLDAFELLTGFPDPRLIEWEAHPNRASVPASRHQNRPSSLA